MRICRSVVRDCKNLDSYGMICVGCNQCGRFTEICINCGSFGFGDDWGSLEFMNLFHAPICPTCRPLFKDEDRFNQTEDIKKYGLSISHKMLGYYADFKKTHR